MSQWRLDPGGESHGCPCTTAGPPGCLALRLLQRPCVHSVSPHWKKRRKGKERERRVGTWDAGHCCREWSDFYRAQARPCKEKSERERRGERERRCVQCPYSSSLGAYMFSLSLALKPPATPHVPPACSEALALVLSRLKIAPDVQKRKRSSTCRERHHKNYINMMKSSAYVHD